VAHDHRVYNISSLKVVFVLGNADLYKSVMYIVHTVNPSLNVKYTHNQRWYDRDDIPLLLEGKK